MIRALYTAATGMKAQQMQIDVTSNNISNVNTMSLLICFIKLWNTPVHPQVQLLNLQLALR